MATKSPGNGDLPAPGNWADDFPLMPAPLDNPVRADAAGMGDEFVVKLKPPNTPGAATQFLSRTGVWVNFASTELNAWGSIIGNIQNQQDLWDELQARPLITDISQVGFTGQYNDLLNKPPLGTVSPIDLNGSTNQFLRGDGQWTIPQDVFARWGNIDGTITDQNDLMALLNTYAPLSNPTFTGDPKAPTPPVDNNSTSIATTAWFFGQAFDGVPVMDGVGSSGDSKRWARGNHRHPTDTTRAPLESPAFTGFPTAPTPPPNDNSDILATTAFVKSVASLPDAPVDGKYYLRQNGAWVAVDLGTRWDNDGLMDGPSFDPGFSDGFGE